MIELIIGGSKSGKSMYSQHRAKELFGGQGRMIYLATMHPADREDRERIRRHVQDREGWGFETLEWERNIAEAAETLCPEDTVLLDSITALLSNEMFVEMNFFPHCGSVILEGLRSLSQKVRHLLLVSDDIFHNAALYDSYTTAYLRTLGHLHQQISLFSQQVTELRCGLSTIHVPS